MLWHKTRWPEVGDQTRLSHHITKPGQPHRRQGQSIPTTPTAAERLAAIQASHHKTSDNNKQGDTMNNELIPLVTIAAEINQDPSRVAARVAEHVVVDPDSGLRCVPAGVCRWLVAEAARAVAASRERDQAARAVQAAQSRLLRERIAARADVQARMRASGLWDDSLSAVAIMCSADKEAQLDYKGRQFEALLAGKSEGARFTATASTEES